MVCFFFSPRHPRHVTVMDKLLDREALRALVMDRARLRERAAHEPQKSAGRALEEHSSKNKWSFGLMFIFVN